MIWKKLYLAKISGERFEICDAINFLINTVSEGLKKDINYLTFYPFIEDERYIFCTQKNTLLNGVVDVTIISTGLLAQLFDSIGIVEYKSLSNDLSDAIFILQAQTELDKNLSKEVKNVFLSLKSIEMALIYI